MTLFFLLCYIPFLINQLSKLSKVRVMDNISSQVITEIEKNIEKNKKIERQRRKIHKQLFF